MSGKVFLRFLYFIRFFNHQILYLLIKLILLKILNEDYKFAIQRVMSNVQILAYTGKLVKYKHISRKTTIYEQFIIYDNIKDLEKFKV